MLGILPSIPSLSNRLKVVGTVAIFLTVLFYGWRLAANTKIFLRKPEIPWYSKSAGLLLVLLEVILAGFGAYLIQKYVR
jgi:hypothetical protein